MLPFLHTVMICQPGMCSRTAWSRPRPEVFEAKARGLQGQGHKILSSRSRPVLEDPIPGMITRRCLNGTARQYLAAHCVPVSVTASRQHLRSAASHQLVVPSYRLSTYGRRAFSVAGPMTWNSLPKQLRDPVHTTFIFAHLLKTFLFSEY